MPTSKELNEFTVTILDDGRVKIESSGFEGASHMAAEKFLAYLEKAIGTDTVRSSSRQGKAHTHVAQKERAEGRS